VNARERPAIAEHAGELPARTREGLARLDREMFAIWNLGNNALLAWTHVAGGLLVLSVRHYAIAESVDPGLGAGDKSHAGPRFINEILSGSKYLRVEAFARACQTFGVAPVAVRIDFPIEDGRLVARVSDMIRCYGVSLVRNRAVVLLDAVQFSLQSPLDQMAMLNSLAYSVNSAYGQLLSKEIRIDFARTTTGDGFYIWNRENTTEANAELYKLMMMMLADNAAARSKARRPWVPRLRAAFHVGEHYEFHQVEGLNPTNFSYIVGEVTVDLARMLDHALPGQILLGEFVTAVGAADGVGAIRCSTLEFVENTAATLDELRGLDISGGRIESIRCYLTGPKEGDGKFRVGRYRVRDKHGAVRTVYNAKINIHRAESEPIFLGLRNDDLLAFGAAHVESPDCDAPGSAA
jgi:hypothetical protein